MTRRMLAYIFAALFFAGLLLFPAECANAVKNALSLCAGALIPSLFPFFTLSAFVLNTGLSADLSRLFSRKNGSFFGLPGACAAPFVSGLLGGYPVGAAAACGLFEAKLCTKKEAERLLFFCSNCGPAFTLGVCGALLSSNRAGAAVFLSHVAASLLCGALSLAFSRRRPPLAPSKQTPQSPSPPLGEALSGALSSACAQTASVCACVVFFFCLMRLVTLSGAFSLLSRALYAPLSLFGASRAFSDALLQGIFEMTNGVYALSSLKGESALLRACGVSFIVGFGGLSVHLQALVPILRSRLSPRLYFCGKTLQALLSAFLTRLFLILLN